MTPPSSPLSTTQDTSHGRPRVARRHPKTRTLANHGRKGAKHGPKAANETFALAFYAAWPGLNGCVTKLLTGRGCNADVALGVADVARARLRLRDDFAFVGLTEQWDASVVSASSRAAPPTRDDGYSPSSRRLSDATPPAAHATRGGLSPLVVRAFFSRSVCLFHAMFGGTFSEANMLHNYRESEKHTTREAKAALKGRTLLPAGWADPHDAAVYAAARGLFVARARAFAPCAAPRVCRDALAAFLRSEDATSASIIEQYTSMRPTTRIEPSIATDSHGGSSDIATSIASTVSTAVSLGSFASSVASHADAAGLTTLSSVSVTSASAVEAGAPPPESTLGTDVASGATAAPRSLTLAALAGALTAALPILA